MDTKTSLKLSLFHHDYFNLYTYFKTLRISAQIMSKILDQNFLEPYDNMFVFTF